MIRSARVRAIQHEARTASSPGRSRRLQEAGGAPASAGPMASCRVSTRGQGLDQGRPKWNGEWSRSTRSAAHRRGSHPCSQATWRIAGATATR